MNSLVQNILTRPIPATAGPYTGPELFGWWDPSDSLNVTKSSGRFDQVNDKSGNGYNLTSAGASRPFDSRTLNGLEVMDFQGGQYFGNNFTSQPHPLTIIYIAKPDDIVNVSWYFCTKSSVNFIGHLNRYGVGPQEYIFAGSTIFGGTPSLSEKIFTVIFDNASSKLYVNGNLTLTGNPGSNAMGGINMGSRHTLSSEFLDGFIGEYTLYNSLITTSQLNQTGQYLSAKWGISYTDIT